MDYLPCEGDLAGWEKKIKVHYEIICITKIIMIAKYVEDATLIYIAKNFAEPH